MAFCALAVNILKYVYMAVMAVFGISNQPLIMHAVFALLGVSCMFIYFEKSLVKSRIIAREVFQIFAVLLFLVFFVAIPCGKYGILKSNYLGMLLTLGSGSIPAYLMGILIRKKDKIDEMGKWVPAFAVILAVAGFMVAINPSTATSGGYVMDDSGFDYQALSYAASYGFGLLVYYMKQRSTIPEFNMFKKPIWTKIFYMCMVLQVITVVLAGGRGGFLVTVIFALYYILLNSKNSLDAIRKIILLVLAMFALFALAQYLDIATAGYERILNSIQSGGGDSERDILFDKAIEIGNENVVLGTGIGTVFYEVGIYSHNIFSDMYCETGLIGLSAFILFLITFFIKLHKLIKINPHNRLVLILFLCGFIMLLYSNYYPAVPFIWFAFGYVFSEKFPKNEVDEF